VEIYFQSEQTRRDHLNLHPHDPKFFWWETMKRTTWSRDQRYARWPKTPGAHCFSELQGDPELRLFVASFQSVFRSKTPLILEIFRQGCLPVTKENLDPGILARARARSSARPGTTDKFVASSPFEPFGGPKAPRHPGRFSPIRAPAPGSRPVGSGLDAPGTNPATPTSSTPINRYTARRYADEHPALPAA
jgi:hypothetical protein